MRSWIREQTYSIVFMLVWMSAAYNLVMLSTIWSNYLQIFLSPTSSIVVSGIAVLLLIISLTFLFFQFSERVQKMVQENHRLETCVQEFPDLLVVVTTERDRAILDCQAARLDRDRAILERDITRAQLRVCSEQFRVYHHALTAEKEESSPPPS